MIKTLLPTGLLALVLAALQCAAVSQDSLKNAPPAYIEALRIAIQTFNAHEFTKTLKALDDAEAILPPTPITLNTRGASLIEQKRFDEGLEFCRKALEIDPKFYPARFNLCEVELVKRNYPEARAAFLKLLDENPKDELIRYRILLTWLLEKNDDQAKRVLDTLPFPGDTPAYYFGNAAWEFAHGNKEEADKWMARGNWVFKPEVTANFSEPFREIGWLSPTRPFHETPPPLPDVNPTPEPAAKTPERESTPAPAPTPRLSN